MEYFVMLDDYQSTISQFWKMLESDIIPDGNSFIAVLKAVKYSDSPDLKEMTLKIEERLH